MNIKKELLKTRRNSIQLEIGGNADFKTGSTHFGGTPDVPENFRWPYYISENSGKSNPLSFIAQFDLEELSRYDSDNMLPKTGLLSFFYDFDSMTRGLDPNDKGSAAVYYFENKNNLKTAELPKDLKPPFRLPSLKITASSVMSYQSYEDFLLQREKLIENWDEFESAQKSIGIDEPQNISKLLGWANPIQENMTRACELVSRGYYLGDGWDHVTPLDKQEAEQWSGNDWLPLFQLDNAADSDFKLVSASFGRIYYYIRRDDLTARNFDNVWLIMQNY